MAEVIGIINGIIALVETSIKIYDSARKDIKLSKNFKAVRYRLPIILDTLAVCKSSLEPRKASIPEDVCEALEKTLEGCEAKASNLRGIFEKIIPGESDTWRNRYSKVLSRYGKGNKVEELMLGLAEEVQLIVNHDAVSSASQKQNFELDDIIREMKSVISSGKDEDKVTMNFNTGGGAQANYINPGRGQQINNSGSVGTLNINSVFQKQKEDFSFCGPVGLQIGQAPYIAPGLFVGRGSELEQIRELLQPALGAHKQQRLVLGGKGGIGKTQLAIAYAESRSESYTSVFWLNASSEAALQKSFLSIARLIFDIQDPLLLENKDVIVRVQRWLSDPLNTGWLLIFDNYDDPNLFDINVYYPPASQGSILVTTRCQDQIEGTIMHVKPLQNTRDGLTILQTRSERDNVQSDVYATRLAERLAGLPLALATAGTYLKHSTFSFERYLCEYEKRWDIGPTQLQEYRERTLYTTWDLSYSRLKAHYADAAELLRLLAYFDNQNLWYELFHDGITEAWPTWLHKLRSCFGEKKPRFKRFHSRIIEGSPKWLSQLLKDDVSFQRVMRTLTEYYFLEVHPASTSWSMHNCVHDWTLATLNEEIDLSYYWYAFDCIDASISGVDIESFGRIAFSRSAGHATRLVQQRFLESNMISNGTFDQLRKTTRIANLLQDQIQLAAAEQMYTRALTGYEKALGPEHTSTLLVVNNLGNLYSHQGILDQAERMYTRALAGYEKALGPQHTSTLDAVGNLGILYSKQDKLEQAEQMYARALAGYEKALGTEHTLTLRTVNNLGTLYSQQGKLEHAEQMYARAIGGYEKALGPEHTSTVLVVNNLGNLYSQQCKLEQAEKMYTRALAGYEKALGPEHISTLRTINDLGTLYSQQGRLEQTEQMYARALAGYEKALGPEHISTLRTVNDLGTLYRQQGRLEQAEQMYARVLGGYEKALGPENPLTLDAIHSFGYLYSHQNKLEDSERMYMRALAGYEKALGSEHTSTLLAVNNLGYLYSQQGKLEQAEQMYTRALAGYEKALGLKHTSTLRTVYNLGNLYSQQGKLEQAEQMFVLVR